MRTNPVHDVNLGGQGQGYQPAREWQLTFGDRRLTSNQYFVGTKESSNLALGGQAPKFSIHTAVAGIAYAFNDRFRIGLSVPVSTGSLTRVWPDKATHKQTADHEGCAALRERISCGVSDRAGPAW